MKKTFLYILLLPFLGLIMMSPIPFFSDKPSEAKKTTGNTNQIMKVLIKKDTECRKVIKDLNLYSEGWDTLPQPRFWSEVMALEPEYSLINIAEKIEVLGVIPSRGYELRSPSGQKYFKDSIRTAHGLPANTSVLVTSGKKHFYLIKQTIPNISRAIDIFTEEGVDPWFAQVILMIESPGANRTSNVGAAGAFQLMPDVARESGLTVNAQVDERLNFRKAAQTAARLLNRVYIAKVREIVRRHGLSYDETDMWFRLLVLHAYHAGPGNVSGVMGAVSPRRGGVDLIRKIWVTEHGGFGNASQNYSQIALAALVEMDRILAKEAKGVCEITEQQF